MWAGMVCGETQYICDTCNPWFCRGISQEVRDVLGHHLIGGKVQCKVVAKGFGLPPGILNITMGDPRNEGIGSIPILPEVQGNIDSIQITADTMVLNLGEYQLRGRHNEDNSE